MRLRRKPAAGRRAMAEFRRRRRQTLRLRWFDVVVLGAGLVTFGAGIGVYEGVPELLAAAMLGAWLTLIIVIWLLGGDARSLTWVWGAAGERQTEDELSRLPEDGGRSTTPQTGRGTGITLLSVPPVSSSSKPSRTPTQRA